MRDSKNQSKNQSMMSKEAIRSIRLFLMRITIVSVVSLLVIVFLPQILSDDWTQQYRYRGQIILVAGGAIAIATLWQTNKTNAYEIQRLEQAKNEMDMRIKHNESELALSQQQFDLRENMSVERELRERYSKAVEQLGSSNPTIRQGGVVVLSGLADDWKMREKDDNTISISQAQVIIDTLCAYLRTPKRTVVPENSDPSFDEAERQIRQGIIKIINTHLKSGKDANWRNLKFNFRGAVIDFDVDLSNLVLDRNSFDFTGATFKNCTLSLDSTAFLGVSWFIVANADFDEGCILVLDKMDLRSHARVSFDGSIFNKTDIEAAKIVMDTGTELIFRNSIFYNKRVGVPNLAVEFDEIYFYIRRMAHATIDFSQAFIMGDLETTLLIGEADKMSFVSLKNLRLMGSRFSVDKPMNGNNPRIDGSGITGYYISNIHSVPNYRDPGVFSLEGREPRMRELSSIRHKRIENGDERIDQVLDHQRSIRRY